MRKALFLMLLAVLVGAMPLQAQKKKPVPAKRPGTSVKKSTPQKKPASGTAKSGTSKNGTPAKQEPEKIKPGRIEESKIDTFKLQVTPLVKFFESSLNFLSDPRNTVKEKQVILAQSYLKWCWDDKVQVEDDLDEARLVPLYKDMPAYLTDVSFFFKNARFSYSVQDVGVENGRDGLTYFRVTANRNLKGVNVYGDSVNSNRVRYIEMNFDSVKQQMKIVSIYTTKLNEREDLRNWWNGLSREWKEIFGKDLKLEGTMPMSEIDSFNDSVAMIGGQRAFIMGSEFYKFLGQITRMQSVDLSGKRSISDLDPLGRLTDLREINVSGTQVSDLMPLRNLNKLESLDISGTSVDRLDALRYCLKITRLRMKGVPIEDISILSSYKDLSTLDISGTWATGLDPLRELTGLKDLRFSHTRIKDLSPLESLINLEIINMSSTPVASLNSLANMQNLMILTCDSTGISSLTPLSGLSNLQRVYCNGTKVGQKEALGFLKQHPDASLVYASKALDDWWKSMTPEWQSLFGFYLKMDKKPTTEQLHRLALIDSINITGRMTVTSLEPVSRLILLRSLQCPSTGITSLGPLAGLTELTALNASNTKVADLKPLSGLVNLETLNIDNTSVADLNPLYGLKSLREVYADNSGVNAAAADRFTRANPDCLLIFQTYQNTTWWKNLSPAWKDVLLRQADLKGEPDKNQLQQIAGLTKLVISENFQITDLTPAQHLTRLKSLQFSGTSVSRLEPVSAMKQLESLALPNNPITDLMPVALLPDLKELDFSNTQVEDLDAIMNMTSLEVLKFNGTQVKNLKYLQKLVNLRVLEFINTRVGNVDVLDGLSRLELIKMFNTKVSQKRVDRLKTTHPRCEIIYY